MRINLKITPNNKPVPFTYQQLLLGTFHKWLGNHNELHDKISLYSFSWLNGGHVKNNALDFSSGATWMIDFWDKSHLLDFLPSIQKYPELFCGMTVSEVIFCKDPVFPRGKNRFILASPMLVKKKGEDNSTQFLTSATKEMSQILTAIIQRKASNAGINDDFSIEVDDTYQKIKTKLVTINGIQNKAVYCPIYVEGSELIQEFVRSVGVGHSTGCGFGFVL